MLGTHNSYTYLTAKCKFLEQFSFLWRCQIKTIHAQKESGVEYFDIRVRRDILHLKDKDQPVWRICHGIIDFDLTFNSLEELLEQFLTYKVRLVLERGNTEDFIKEVEKIKECPWLSYACIKKDWKIIVNRDPYLIDYTYAPWLSWLSFWENIKRFNFFSTIKSWAKKHNPIVNDIIKKDQNTIYFIDYA